MQRNPLKTVGIAVNKSLNKDFFLIHKFQEKQSWEKLN